MLKVFMICFKNDDYCINETQNNLNNTKIYLSLKWVKNSKNLY